MIKRLLHIIFVVILTQCVSFAKDMSGNLLYNIKPADHHFVPATEYLAVIDTTRVKKPDADDKKKIKEIPMAKRQAKPEKLVIGPVDTLGSKSKIKPPRQRRPDGLVRPPEIPRRNNN